MDPRDRCINGVYGAIQMGSTIVPACAAAALFWAKAPALFRGHSMNSLFSSFLGQRSSTVFWEGQF